MSVIALEHDGLTVRFVPLGWGVVDVRPADATGLGESLGVVEPARGARLARPACGCAPMPIATAVDAARWLIHHAGQHREDMQP